MSTPVVLFVSLLLFMIIGVPVAWSLSLSCIAALLTMDGMPLVLLTQRVFTGANNFSFLAVPAFIIAGEVMSQGGISKRLVDMTSVMLGRVRGSLGIISVVASTIFAALSGSATATTAAIGGLMYPEMERRGYPKDFSAAVQAIGGTLGPVIPPSLMMIFYGVATGEPITKLLMSGVVPGILTCILLCLMVYIIAKKRDMPVEDEPFSWKRLWDATKDSVLALLMPMIILVTIYFGICTATESAAIAAVYGIIIAKFVYRSVSWKGLWEIFKKSALQTVVVSIMVVTAQLFGWIVTYYNIPNLLATSIQSIASSATVPVPCAGDAADRRYVYGSPVRGNHRSAHSASRRAGLWYRSHLLRFLYRFHYVHRYCYAALRPLPVRLLQPFPAALCQGVQGNIALYCGGGIGCHHPDLPAADRYIPSQSGKIRGIV